MDMSTFRPGQEASIEHLDGPLLICAGAGSGKTFTLTQRIAWALMDGSGPDGSAFLNGIDQALVITFTDKAAGEIKDRIRSTLRAEGMVDEALKADGAWVSTIHGMCARVLHEHAVEFGIDPAFALIMGAKQEEALRQAITAVVDRLNQQGGNNPYRALFGAYDAGTVADYLKDILNQASCRTQGLDSFEFGPEPADPCLLARTMLPLCEDLQANGTATSSAIAGTMAEALQDFLLDGSAADDVFDAVLADTDSGRLRGDATLELREAIRTARAERMLGASFPHAHSLVSLAREVERAYQGILEAQGSIDASGLIRTTLAAFRNHPQIAAEYTERFKLIMVDEFQDTSQLQIDMIEQIAGPDREHLCTVGDSQQSIYRFQGADVQVYLQHKKNMQDPAVGAKTVQLADNFRSHPDILAFVRKVCGQPGYFQEDFLDLQAATGGHCYKSTSPRVEVALTSYARGGTAAANKAEAQHIAQRFDELRAAGHTASDMVVLMGSTTSADVYAQALREHGFACIIAGGSKYFQSEHVHLCQSLLCVLANPYDSEKLLDVLTSDVLPISSDDLLYLSTFINEDTGLPIRQNPARGFLLSDSKPLHSSPLLQHASKVLARAWAKLGAVRPAQLFLETIVEAGWLERLQEGGAEGQAKAADILKFARLVKDEQKIDGYDMARIAKAMDASFSGSTEKPGALSVEGLDAVRIMTVHASKGLEFPIVAVTNCYNARNQGGTLAMLADRSSTYLSLRPKHSDEKVCSKTDETDPGGPGDAQTQFSYRAAIMSANKNRDQMERRRLFYVAATRASDALIIAIKHSVGKENRYDQVEGDILNGLCCGQNDFPEESCTLEYGGSKPLAFTRITVETESDAESPSETEGSSCSEQNGQGRPVIVPLLDEPERIAITPLSQRAGFFSYSSIAPHAGLRPAQDEDDAGIAADEATGFGSALHRTCEWLALQSQELSMQAAQHTLDRFCRLYRIIDADRLRAAFSCWFDSDARKRAFSYERHQPEVPFCTQLDDLVLEGEIDLLCTNDSRSAFIVDYKTGGNAAETPDQLHAKHLLQAQCYAYASLKAGYSEVELLFVRVEQFDTVSQSGSTSEKRTPQPQTVGYRFTSDDLPRIEQAIRMAWKTAHGIAV
jgi:ATP-dependent helicase/nuclease subunit A